MEEASTPLFSNIISEPEGPIENLKKFEQFLKKIKNSRYQYIKEEII